jgi:hypothetical protein
MAVLSLSFFVQPSYAQQTGTVRVDITPANDGRMQWRLGNGNWLMSGAQTTVPLGTYQLEFKEVSGYHKPGNQEVYVRYPTNYTQTATYFLLEGAVQVNIEPAEVIIRRQPKWSGTWDGIKHVQVLGGVRIDHIRAGSHTVKFEDASPCWTRPQDQPVTVVDGQTATVRGTYRAECGWVRVKIEPGEAVAQGAQWRILDRPWRNSGESEVWVVDQRTWVAPVYPREITIKIPAGWRLKSPLPLPVQVSVDGTTDVTAKLTK